jgi:hypothetical protein
MRMRIERKREDGRMELVEGFRGGGGVFIEGVVGV